MSNSRLKINVISSLLQTGTSAVTMIILYRYLIDIIGVEKFGLWSLVLGISSIVQAGNLGLTGSLVKYVADYDANNDYARMSKAIQTSVLTTALFALIIIGAAFPIGIFYLKLTVSGSLREQAIEILPVALAAFWVMMLTGNYQSALYGCRKIAERNIVLIFEAIAHFFLCMFLANEYGLLGLAYARFGINIVTLLLTIIILKRTNTLMPMIPHTWDKVLFKSMLGYALNTQLITLLVMMCDPLVKGLLSRNGSPADVGYYEMANKVVQQVRAILINSFQVMVPEFARLNNQAPEKLQGYYFSGLNAVFFASLCCYSLVIAVSPLVSTLWIGNLNSIFIFAYCTLAVAEFYKSIAVPAYFANQGTGHLRDNVVSHLLTVLVNILLGYYLGRQFGVYGVILAWCFAQICSGFFQSIAYQIKNTDKLSLVPKNQRALYLWTIFVLLACYLAFDRFDEYQYIVLYEPIMELISVDLLKSITVVMLFIILASGPLMLNPVGRQLISRFLSKK
jgi:O-antigen/teichoic acid export membrane protein